MSTADEILASLRGEIDEDFAREVVEALHGGTDGKMRREIAEEQHREANEMREAIMQIREGHDDSLPTFEELEEARDGISGWIAQDTFAVAEKRLADAIMRHRAPESYAVAEERAREIGANTNRRYLQAGYKDPEQRAAKAATTLCSISESLGRAEKEDSR